MADFEEVVNTRRSIREYDSKEVEDEKIEKILKAAMQAPGVAPEEERMDKIAKLVGIDDENLKVFCLITLGYPKEGLKKRIHGQI